MPSEVKSRHRRLPVVLSRGEVGALIDGLRGGYWPVASLMYGSGLRLMEVLRLRCKDVHFERKMLLVRDGKGGKHRVTLLPDSLLKPLTTQLRRVRERHQLALANGCGGVGLPQAVARRYPGAHLALGWQYLFPADKPSHDPRTGAWRPHHLHEIPVQRQVRKAVRRAHIDKPASWHTLRHCFATHLLEQGYDIRTLQDLPGHGDVPTTQIYTRVMQKGSRGVLILLDSAGASPAPGAHLTSSIALRGRDHPRTPP